VSEGEVMESLLKALDEAWGLLARFEDEGQPKAPCDREIEDARKRKNAAIRAARKAK